jgi:hypothetical protein
LVEHKSAISTVFKQERRRKENRIGRMGKISADYLSCPSVSFTDE